MSKRLPKYLSNSALALWETDREEYYLRYLCGQVTPKIAQTRPMAVGSAFDGMIKNKIEAFCGMTPVDYSKQIEVAGRAQAALDGQEVLSFYLRASGLDRLLVTGVPRLEFSVSCEVPGTAHCVGGPVILLGKPDLYYKVCGQRIVHDWKVNGFCSKASPHKGYVWDSKTQMAQTFPRMVAGRAYGKVENFPWIDQLTGYGWCLGEPLGSDFELQVHQITRLGVLRLTEYRIMADATHQHLLRDRLVGCWEAIHQGRCFTDLSISDDLAKQKTLDLRAAGLQDPVFNMLVGR